MSGIGPTKGPSFQNSPEKAPRGLADQSAGTRKMAQRIEKATNPLALRGNMGKEIEQAATGLAQVMAKQAKDQKELADATALLALKEEYGSMSKEFLGELKKLDGAAALDHINRFGFEQKYQGILSKAEQMDIAPKAALGFKSTMMNLHMGNSIQLLTLQGTAIKKTATNNAELHAGRTLSDYAASGTFRPGEQVYAEVVTNLGANMDYIDESKFKLWFGTKYKQYFNDYASHHYLAGVKGKNPEQLRALGAQMEELAKRDEADEKGNKLNSFVDPSDANTWAAKFFTAADQLEKTNKSDYMETIKTDAKRIAKDAVDSVKFLSSDVAATAITGHTDSNQVAAVIEQVDLRLNKLGNYIEILRDAGEGIPESVLNSYVDAAAARTVVSMFLRDDVRKHLADMPTTAMSEEFIMNLADRYFSKIDGENLELRKAKELFIGTLQKEANLYQSDSKGYMTRVGLREGLDGVSAELRAIEDMRSQGRTYDPLLGPDRAAYTASQAEDKTPVERQLGIHTALRSLRSDEERVMFTRRELGTGLSPHMVELAVANPVVFDIAKRVKAGEDPLAEGADILNKHQLVEYKNTLSAFDKISVAQRNYVLGADHGDEARRVSAAIFAADNVTADNAKRTLIQQVLTSTVKPWSIGDKKSPFSPDFVPDNSMNLVIHRGSPLFTKYDLVLSGETLKKINPRDMEYLTLPAGFETIAKYAGIPQDMTAVNEHITKTLAGNNLIARSKMLQSIGVRAHSNGTFTDTHGNVLTKEAYIGKISAFANRKLAESQIILRDGANGAYVLTSHPDGGMALRSRETNTYIGGNIAENLLPQMLKDAEKKIGIQGGVDAGLQGSRKYIEAFIKELPSYAVQAGGKVAEGSEYARKGIHAGMELTEDAAETLFRLCQRGVKTLGMKPIEGPEHDVLSGQYQVRQDWTGVDMFKQFPQEGDK